jgi:predicted acetyltransferase
MEIQHYLLQVLQLMVVLEVSSVALVADGMAAAAAARVILAAVAVLEEEMRKVQEAEVLHGLILLYSKFQTFQILIQATVG